MSNARKLANLLGTSTTVPSSKLSLVSGDMPTGSVLQVVSGTNTNSSSLNGMTDLITLDITPSTTSSKILLQFSGVASSVRRYVGYQLFRGSTQIAMGATPGNRATVIAALDSNNDSTNDGYCGRSAAACYIDSPSSTSQITYKLKGGNYYTSGSGYEFELNRAALDSDDAYMIRGIHSFIAIEIAG